MQALEAGAELDGDRLATHDLRLADHDGEAHGRLGIAIPAAFHGLFSQVNVSLDLEAEFAVVGRVALRAGLEIHGSVFYIGLCVFFI